MKKNIVISIVLLIILLIAGVGFWRWKNTKNTQVSVNNQKQSQQEQQSFVVDVDPNVDHWQTKETEFFIIKFPKEWHWLESVIANNPNFDMVKYADIGIFTGGNYPLVITNNTEIVISFNGSATSDAGTSQDSIDAILEMAKDNNPSVDCKVSNNKTIPFTAYCVATYDFQLQQSYYVIDNKISLVFTARTTKDTIVKKEILDKIARSIILK